METGLLGLFFLAGITSCCISLDCVPADDGENAADSDFPLPCSRDAPQSLQKIP